MADRPSRAIFLATLAVAVAACDAEDPVTPPPPPPTGAVPMADLLDGGMTVASNPSGIAPLTAELRFVTEVPATTSLTVLGTPGDAPLEAPSAEISVIEHALPVLGLKPDAWNAVELRVDGPERHAVDTIFISADPLPENFPRIDVTRVGTGQVEPGWTLGTLALGHEDGFTPMPVMFDERGAIRWYLDLSGSGELAWPVERLSNGNLVIGATGSGSVVREYDMLGNVVAQWHIPGWVQHHDVVEKPDGNLLIAVDRVGLETIEDHVLELARPSGQIVRQWDLRQVLDVDRSDLVDNPADWMHVNSVWHDPSDDGIVISGRHQGVVKVSRENELVWILAPHRGWGRAGLDGEGAPTSEALLTAVDAEGVPYPEAVQDGTESVPGFDWPWAQHAAMYLPNGNLLLFDNGFRRNFTEDPLYSRAVEYEIDEVEMTVRQVWAFGEERGSAWYSPIVSDVDYLPITGNRLLTSGYIGPGDDHRAWITELDPGGGVSFEAVLHMETEPGTRPDVLYRAERLPIYPD